ncbi:hyaluronan mediated motility receptor-like [Onthophagus taurus]|uniref:hyaluronan mediated motility receptor-like n=1 Tax=Onthophagus taurus TaxID=166361 RepID=UPI0039BEB13F
MSFPKAKITRFNDITDCTPSPAHYNPKGNNRMVGGVITDKDDNGSVSSTSSTRFRTPKSVKKTKPFASKESLKTEDSETLKEKIVECDNKDAYIQELLDQLSNLKEETVYLQSQKDLIAKEANDFKLELKKITEEHSMSLQVIKLCFSNDQKKLNNQIRDLADECDELRDAHDEVLNWFSLEYAKVSDSSEKMTEFFNTSLAKYAYNLDDSHKKIVEKENELELLESKLDAVKYAHKISIENCYQTHQENIKNLEMRIIEKMRDIEFDCLDDEYVEVRDEEVQTEDLFDLMRPICDPKRVKKDKLSQNCISPNTPLDVKGLSDIIQNKYKEKYEKLENEIKLYNKNEIKALKVSQNIEIDAIKSENDVHLQQIKENYDESLHLGRIQAEEECKVIELDYKVKLEALQDENEAVLSECEKIGEYTISESELERDKLKQEVNEIKNELIEEQKNKADFLEYDKLCKDYDLAVDQHKSLETDLLNVLLKKQLQINNFKNDHFTYNVTIHKTRETIDALTKRLIESDNDVVQLKNEIKEMEEKALNFDEKKLKLNDELDGLTKLNDDLKLQKESTSKLYENNLKDLENNLLQTVEMYKESVAKMISDYKIKAETTEYDLQEVVKCLYEQEVVNSEAYNLIHLANNEIEDLEKNNRLFEDKICTLRLELEQSKSKIDQLKTSKKEMKEKLKYEQLQNAQLQEEIIKSKQEQEEIETLHKQIAQLKEKKQTYSEYCKYYSAKAKDYEVVINEMNEINRSYIDQTQKYENLVQKCEEINSKNDELQRIAAEKEILIGPFKQQLENYKVEWQNLIAQKTDAENEARSVGMRYAEVLGHQNQKQKIKYIVDLKEKHFSLLKEKETMESKLRAQTKTIEKLKSELAMVGKSPKKKKVKVIIVKESEANKENSLHESFASPLRDRNRDE